MINNLMEMLVVVLLPFSALVTAIVIVMLLTVYLVSRLWEFFDRIKGGGVDA